MSHTFLLPAISCILFLSGCASIPKEPSLMALPGSGMSFEQFRQDDSDCRQHAFQQIGGRESAANNAGLRSAAAGAAIGTAAGAAIGGGRGAAVGAGAGLAIGSVAASDTMQRETYGSQRQYDQAYTQCMYARGHRVPVSASMARSLQERAAPTPASSPEGFVPPPPPPGF